ncbi:uncharacterized protein ASCRUDRAFT_75016, partial [Ascoidea rubescens DSM 1968]
MNQLQPQPQQQSLVNQEYHATPFFSNPNFYKLITPELKETLPYVSVIRQTKIPNSSSTMVFSDILSFVPLLESNDMKASVFNRSNNKIIASKLVNAKIDGLIQRTLINSEDSKALIIRKFKKPLDFSSEKKIVSLSNSKPKEIEYQNGEFSNSHDKEGNDAKAQNLENGIAEKALNFKSSTDKENL